MTTEIGIGCFVAAACVAALVERMRCRVHAATGEKARRMARMMLAGKTIRRV
jgi:hypothetical protein